jgi:hypothetical protein
MSTNGIRIISFGNSYSIRSLIIPLPNSLSETDGSGLRSISQLEVLRNIMHRIQWNTNPEDPEKVILPCDYFDLMGGTDTGGLDAHLDCPHCLNSLYHRLITLFLVKCRMSVDEALDVFYDICETVYVDTTIDAAERSGRLRHCLENILKNKGLPIDLKLGRDDRTTKTTKCVGYGPYLLWEIVLICQITI